MRALEVWDAGDGRFDGPFNGVVLGNRFMNDDRRALFKLLLPMTVDEAEALSALDWLERDVELPPSVQTYFWDKLKRAADAILPKIARESLLGSDDAGRYREAITAHFARRRDSPR